MDTTVERLDHLTPRRYPGISFEFDLTPRRVDLVAEPVDVAIRMGELPNSHLIARQLARLPRYLYASPRYSGEPSQPADLTQHECLLLRGQANTWTLHHAAETVEVTVGGQFRLNSIGMMQRLAALDLGIAMLAEETQARASPVEISRSQRSLTCMYGSAQTLSRPCLM